MGLVLFLKESIVGLGQYVESLKVMPINIESHKESNSCLFTFGLRLTPKNPLHKYFLWSWFYS